VASTIATSGARPELSASPVRRARADASGQNVLQQRTQSADLARRRGHPNTSQLHLRSALRSDDLTTMSASANPHNELTWARTFKSRG
jgi:hypothetical protein